MKIALISKMKIALISKTPEGTILIKIVTPGSNFQNWIEVDRIELSEELIRDTHHKK